MDFSDQWRSLFSTTSIFSSPSLFNSSSSIGPLNFLPSSPYHLLYHLPSFQIAPPLSSTELSLLSFFNSDPSSFLPHSSLSSLAADLLSSESSPVSTNNLCVLRSRNDPSNLILFFPSGENSHSIGFLTLSVSNGEKVAVSKMYTQKDGFKHPYHRILTMSVASASESDVSWEPDCLIEGFLLVTTMYSVNWFRVESREERGVLVVPMAKLGFDRLVVDGKMSPHCSEMSVVLLESGQLCWFEMESMRSGKIEVCDGESIGDWLGCEFGGQPWIVFVAFSLGVCVVDLRGKKGTEPKVLVTMDKDRNDRIAAFCVSSFDDFHISVVTERQLLLFDVRQPLVPVLTWDHGLCNPCYVSIFRLWELRSCENFKWASDSGSVILVGSFWSDEFSMFVYGPREGAARVDSFLYAWELPLVFSLSGRQCTAGDSLVKDSLSTSAESRHKKDVVIGFWIIPNNRFNVSSESGGFALIRLMLSGKLEMQWYHASMDSSVSTKLSEGEELPKLEDSVLRSLEKKGKTTFRYYTINIGHLWEYMNGFSSSKLALCKPQLSHYAKKFPIDHLKELEDMKLKSSAASITTVINDASIPTSVFEITAQRILNDLEVDLLSLAFSKYSLLLECHGETIVPLLQVTKCLPHRKSIPFFVAKPLRISEKLSKNALRGEDLVGPVFPIPFLLLLKWMDDHLKEEPHGDLLTPQSQSILDNLYPEISLADNGCSSQTLQNEKSFFIYEKSVVGDTSSCKDFRRKEESAVEEEAPKADDNCLEPQIASEDEKFTTFVCGLADKTCYSSSGNEAVGFEIFDRLNPYRLDFDSPPVVFLPKEQEMYKRLTRQSSRWLQAYKPHQDFCISSDITTQPC